MADPIAELIQTIAVKHGIAVARDDPIMILQTLHERLMQDAATSQQERLDHFKEELEAIAHRWGEEARHQAERTLNTARTASQEVMAKGLQASAQAAGETMRRETDAAIANIAAVLREARRVALMNLVAAGMTVCAAGLALWATW